MLRFSIVLSVVLLVSGTPNYDRNLHCPEWSKENNECSKNPRYMWSSCLTSCVQNTVDDDDDCQSFAEQGECSNNPGYVHLHCPHACSLGIAWNPWTRRDLGITPAEFNEEIAREDCVPTDLFSAAEVMYIRVFKYVNGGHNSVKGLVSTSPSEYLGMMGLVEAVLYTLRLHEVILHSHDDEEVLSKVNDRHNAAKSNYLFIQEVEHLLSQGYASDLLMRKMPDFLSFLTDSRAALHTIFDLPSSDESLSVSALCDGTKRGPDAHHLAHYFRGVTAGEVSLSGSTTSSVGSGGRNNAKDVELLSGIKMPLMGLGTWQLEGDVAVAAVYEAVKLGYRLFDTAQAYRNEEQVGAAVSRAIAEGVVQREDLFLCSKLSFPEHGGYLKAKELVKSQLAALQVTYLDLYMLHSPLEDRAQRQTWRALEELHQEGVLKSIGVSNFDASELQHLLSYAVVKPMVVQNKLDIYHYGKQLDNKGDAVVQLASSMGIAVQAYSPFSAYPFMMVPVQDPVVQSIAHRLGLTAAQLLLRWTTQHGVVALPRSSNVDRLRENLSALEAELLSAEDMSTLDTLQYLVQSPVSKVVDM